VNCTILGPRPFLSGTACYLMLLSATQVFGADSYIKPKITVSEEYTDNVFDDLTNKSDFITRVQPGLLLKYSAPLWDWNLDYAYDYRYYAKGSRAHDSTQNINGTGLVKIIDEKLFLELSDVYSRVSLDVARNTTNESLFAQQTDQNVGSVSPYLVLHPSGQLTLKTGYRYTNTWYKDPQAIPNQVNAGFFNSSYEFSPKFFMTGDYTFSREIPRRGLTFNRQEAYLGPRYEYADKSFVFAKGGVIATDFDGGSHQVDPTWNAGLTHTFDPVTANLSTGATYTADPLGTSTLQTSYSASLTKILQRGSLTLQGSYVKLSTESTGVVSGNNQDNNTYSGSLGGTYELLMDLTGNLGLTYQKYHDLNVDGTTDRYFVDCGLNYNFGRDLTAGLSYKYSDYSSAVIAQDNRRVNRVILEAKKVF